MIPVSHFAGKKGIVVADFKLKTSMEAKEVSKHSLLSNVLQYGAMSTSLLGGICLTIPHWGMFAFWIVACLCWIAFGTINKHWGLVITQCFFFIINVISLYRLITGAWHN